MRCLLSGVRLLTLSATPGGPRPFAQLTCNLLRRLWAPDLGVQACGPAPLTARHARGPHQARRVSWAAGTKAYGCTSPEGAEGTGAAAGHARRKERDAPRLNRGVHRGFAPYARSLGTFSGARESTPPVGAGPDDLEISSAGTGPGVGQDGLSTSIRHPSLSYFKSWIWVRVFRAMSRIFTASVTVAMRV